MITKLTSKVFTDFELQYNFKDFFTVKVPISHVYKHRLVKSIGIWVTFSIVDQKSRIKFD